MKVFKVITRHTNESNEVVDTVQYVTQEENNISLVTQYFQKECDEFGAELISVSYVIDITDRVKSPKELNNEKA